MLAEGKTGPQTVNDGGQITHRMTKLGGLVVQELHGRYYEQTYRKNVFFAANTAVQATSVGLATTYTGLCLSNPLGSTVNLVLLSLGFALTSAPAAASTLGLITGFSNSTNVLHTTAIIPASTFIGAQAGAGKVGAASTLSITPVYTQQYAQYPITTEGTSGPILVDLAGQIILPPGAFAALGTLTSITGLGHFTWEEVIV